MVYEWGLGKCVKPLIYSTHDKLTAIAISLAFIMTTKFYTYCICF